jgi:predicted nucleic acid-binding protein
VRFYIDSSAFVKLIFPEPESGQLVGALGEGDELVSSDLLKIEVLRAVRRREPGPGAGRGAERWLESVALIPITPEVRDRAAVIGPPAMRALDAIHAATMDQVQEHIDGVIAYDDRLIDASNLLGISVLSPR